MTFSTTKNFEANGLPMLVGSLPLTDLDQALDWVFATTPEIPLWPQLPSNPYERMMPQFAEGIPCITEEDLTDIKVELVDRFGPLPEETDALLRISSLQLKAKAFDIRKIEVGPKGGRVTFRENPDIDPLTIINLIQLQPKHYALDGPEKLLLKGDFLVNENRIQAVWRLLGELG